MGEWDDLDVHPVIEEEVPGLKAQRYVWWVGGGGTRAHAGVGAWGCWSGSGGGRAGGDEVGTAACGAFDRAGGLVREPRWSRGAGVGRTGVGEGPLGGRPAGVTARVVAVSDRVLLSRCFFFFFFGSFLRAWTLRSGVVRPRAVCLVPLAAVRPPLPLFLWRAPTQCGVHYRHGQLRRHPGCRPGHCVGRDVPHWPAPYVLGATRAVARARGRRGSGGGSLFAPQRPGGSRGCRMVYVSLRAWPALWVTLTRGTGED